MLYNIFNIVLNNEWHCGELVLGITFHPVYMGDVCFSLSFITGFFLENKKYVSETRSVSALR
jgi:hypothetical protein